MCNPGLSCVQIFGPEAVLTTPENIMRIDHFTPATMTVKEIMACINYGLAANSVDHLLLADTAIKADDCNGEKIALMRELADAKRLVSAHYYGEAEKNITDCDTALNHLKEGWRIQKTILEGPSSKLSGRKRKILRDVAKTHTIDELEVARLIGDFEAWAV